MSMLNVNREVQDSFYRYKMPGILAKVEGKGNGVKTVIVNMSDIARALGRPATYTCKFFGCELGAQTQLDIKRDRYIVNGSHDAPRLQDMLDIFIKKFVLCQECDNPETTMVVKRNETIVLSCKACGAQSKVDLRHKVCTYMVRNPPEKVKKPNSPAERRHSTEEVQKDEVIVTKPSPIKSLNEFSLDGWSVETSEEAVASRMKEITAGAETLALNNDLEKTALERAEILYKFVSSHVTAGTVQSCNKEITHEAVRLEMQNKAPLILVELLCDANMREQLKTHRELFLRICLNNKKAQKSMLGAFEKIVELHQSKLLPKVAHIVKDLYDYDIVDEEQLIEWGGHISKRFVSKDLSRSIHEKAQPVITWLKEADEESSDEEDEQEIENESSDQDDVPVAAAAASDAVKVDLNKLTPAKVEEGAGDADGNINGENDDSEDNDDIDIDDI